MPAVSTLHRRGAPPLNKSIYDLRSTPSRADEKLNRCCQHDIQNRRRQQKLPTEVHQLIETKSREGAAQPNVQKQKEQYLREKVNHAQERNLCYAWPVPAAEKQGCGQHRHSDHVDVLGVEKQQKFY